MFPLTSELSDWLSAIQSAIHMLKNYAIEGNKMNQFF